MLVVLEYNHGYPGLLKHVLDTNLKEYIHKAVGICRVSAGGCGGTRVIENLLLVVRELGLVTICWDGNFSAVRNLFDANGTLVDPACLKLTDKFIKELVWTAQTLRIWTRAHSPGAIAAERRLRRENMATTHAMRCSQCGIAMNSHAEKIDYLAALINPEAIDPDLGGVMEEVQTCLGWGNTETRRAEEGV